MGDEIMPEQPYEPHWSESYIEPEEYPEFDDDIAEKEARERQSVLDDVPEYPAAKITPIFKSHCNLCGFGPLLPPWDEGEPVKCPNCGAHNMIAGHA